MQKKKNKEKIVLKTYDLITSKSLIKVMKQLVWFINIIIMYISYLRKQNYFLFYEFCIRYQLF